MLVKGKNAIVTGASRGIGLATVTALAENGAAHIWACVRNLDDSLESDFDKLSQRTDSVIAPICFDFENEESSLTAAKTIINERKIIDILINNAGSIHTGLFLMSSTADIRRMYDLNVVGPLGFSQRIIRGMVRHTGGAIINVSSSAAIDGNVGRLGYAASKAALATASIVMARELGRYGIRVNCVAPGLTETAMLRENTSDQLIDDLCRDIALGRVGDPAEIAQTLLFLASDLSSYITGQIIRVDGGM